MRTNTRLTAREPALGRSLFIRVSLAVALAAAAPLHAEDVAQPAGVARTAVDGRWQPWLGCWDLLRDTVHEPSAARPGEPFRPGSGRTTPGETRVCIVPAAGGQGVQLRADVQGQPVFDETIVADGAKHDVTDDQACTGWRRDEWSVDGQRLFGRAELTCAGAHPQLVSRMAFLTGPASWLEVQSITAGKREGVRVRRYRRVGVEPPAFGDRRDVHGRVFDVDTVTEATRKVDPLVLQAALVETQARFSLDGRTLLALREAGVPGDITDLMIALSYPNRFRVTRARATGGGVGPDDWSLYDTTWTSFSYSDWGFGGGWWWLPPDYIVGEPGGGGGGPSEGHGRVVNNRGYTRIETVKTARAADRGRGSTASSSGDSSSSSSGGSSSGSGSSSSGASPSGYSGGGSDSGGRTAVPR